MLQARERALPSYQACLPDNPKEIMKDEPLQILHTKQKTGEFLPCRLVVLVGSAASQPQTDKR